MPPLRKIAHISVEEDKTCSISRVIRNGILPCAMTGLTPNQAVDAEKLAQECYQHGYEQAVREIRDRLPAIED